MARMESAVTREQAFAYWLDNARRSLDRLASCHQAERLRNARLLHRAAERLVDIGMSHYASPNHSAGLNSCAAGEPAEVTK